MATEASKKLEEQNKHDQRQHVGGMEADLAAHVAGLDAISAGTSILQKKYEAATKETLADEVVGLISAEEAKERKVVEEDQAGGEKNSGVYQF